MPDPKPKVYVVVTGRFGTSDVSGILMHADGEVTAQHVSSSVSWLQNDLTTSFADRREALEARYPGGYDVQVVDLFDEDPPPEIAEHFTKRDAHQRALNKLDSPATEEVVDG